MASLGHIAVGMAVGRAFAPKGATTGQLAKAMAAFSALSMLPDADVIAFKLGIPYEAPFGHRGATHSIGFALLVTAAAFGVAAALKLPRNRVAACAFVAVLTHPLLDMLTDGGFGCALFWPVSNARLFFPVTPLPVAPIGAGMFSGQGLYVILVELVAFLPLWIYATAPRKRAAP